MRNAAACCFAPSFSASIATWRRRRSKFARRVVAVLAPAPFSSSALPGFVVAEGVTWVKLEQMARRRRVIANWEEVRVAKFRVAEPEDHLPRVEMALALLKNPFDHNHPNPVNETD